MKATPTLLAAALAGIKTQLDGGTLFYFAGPVPANAGDALDMASQHTQLVALSASGGGLNFDAPTGGNLPKAAAQTWQGTVDFDGAQSGAGTLTPTFFRFCKAGDNGRGGAAGTMRVQGTIGGPQSSADIKLGDGTTLTDNGSNSRSLPIFAIEQLLTG